MTINDVHKRIKNTKYAGTTNSSMMIENASKAISTNNPKEIMRSIEFITNNTNPVLFETVMDLFDALYECDNSTAGQLNKMSNYICNEAVMKVRSAKKTNTNLKRKLGNIRSKVTTKINNSIQKSLNNSIKKAIKKKYVIDAYCYYSSMVEPESRIRTASETINNEVLKRKKLIK